MADNYGYKLTAQPRNEVVATLQVLPPTVPTPNNGAKVIAAMWQLDHWVVACYQGHTHADPYVTWVMGNDGECVWGHYCSTLDTCLADWAKQVGM